MRIPNYLSPNLANYFSEDGAGVRDDHGFGVEKALRVAAALHSAAANAASPRSAAEQDNMKPNHTWTAAQRESAIKSFCDSIMHDMLVDSVFSNDDAGEQEPLF